MICWIPDWLVGILVALVSAAAGWFAWEVVARARQLRDEARSGWAANSPGPGWLSPEREFSGVRPRPPELDDLDGDPPGTAA